MRLRPQKSPRLVLALFSAAIVTLITVAALQGSKREGDEAPTVMGEAHWSDALLAEREIASWLRASPDTPTITISRKEVAWVHALTASAARQAQPKPDNKARYISTEAH
jgi:hypothetical protein